MEAIFKQIVKARRVASAYIFSGPEQEQKIKAAESFAKDLGIGPKQIIRLLPDGASLKIEQVKQLRELIRYGALGQDHLMVLVQEADKLTDQAAAALLKTLEEPASGVVFVLLVEREEKLLATIYSRCQKIVFPEINFKWQPREEFVAYYDALKQLKQSTLDQDLCFALKISKQKNKLEEILYELAYYARHALNNMRYARTILDSLRSIKRKANPRTALDVMFFNLRSENA